MDGTADLTSMDATGRHPMDGGEATHNPPTSTTRRCWRRPATRSRSPGLRKCCPLGGGEDAVRLADDPELLAPLLKRAFGEDRDGGWRLVPTMANRMPTAASYLRPGDSEFRALKLDVLRVKDGRISEITTFGAALSRRSACQRHFHDAARRAVSAALGDLQDCRAGEAPL